MRDEAGQVLTTAHAEIIKLRIKALHDMEKMLDGVDITDVNYWIVQIVDGQVSYMMTPHCLSSMAYALTLMFLTLQDMAVQIGSQDVKEKIKEVVANAYRDHVSGAIDEVDVIPEKIWAELLTKAAIDDL